MKYVQEGKEYLYIGDYNPNEILRNIDRWPAISHWWGERHATNLVTVDEGAGQMRAVGRLSFFYHFEKIYPRLKQMVQELMSVSNRDTLLRSGYEVANHTPIIYLTFSLCGGTGSSLFLDVAYVLRKLFSLSNIKPIIVAFAVLPGPHLRNIGSMPQQKRLQANTYASLQELERLHCLVLEQKQQKKGNFLWDVEYAANFRVTSPVLPFDYIYLIDDTTLHGEHYTRQYLYELISQAIFWLSVPPSATRFWSKAKNLISNTLIEGAHSHVSGMQRLRKYSLLGVGISSIDNKLDMKYQIRQLSERADYMCGFRENEGLLYKDLEFINLLNIPRSVTNLGISSDLEQSLDFSVQGIDILESDISNELVLLKTLHGLPITSFTILDELYNAYNEMEIIREAPYLHLDNREDVELTYLPLLPIVMTNHEIVDRWLGIVRDLKHAKEASIADYIDQLLIQYKNFREQANVYDDVVQVSDDKDILFQLVDLFESYFDSRPKIAVEAAYLALAELKGLLATNGWKKMQTGKWVRIIT